MEEGIKLFLSFLIILLILFGFAAFLFAVIYAVCWRRRVQQRRELQRRQEMYELAERERAGRLRQFLQRLQAQKEEGEEEGEEEQELSLSPSSQQGKGEKGEVIKDMMGETVDGVEMKCTPKLEGLKAEPIH
ncbi:uncharacterized protein TM35_000262030, partial [Trypanosoma theileri]